MGRKPTGKPNGCTPREIDWEQVEKWIIAGSKGTQIAARLGICPDTLYDRCYKEKGMAFSHYFQEKRAIGDSMIENVQFEMGIVKKNVPMLIWLGKTRCGQREVDNDKMNVDPKAVEAFQTLIQYIQKNQSERTNPSNSQSTDSKSE